MGHQSHKIGCVWKPGFLKSGHILRLTVTMQPFQSEDCVLLFPSKASCDICNLMALFYINS